MRLVSYPITVGVEGGSRSCQKDGAQGSSRGSSCRDVGSTPAAPLGGGTVLLVRDSGNPWVPSLSRSSAAKVRWGRLSWRVSLYP